MIEVAHLTYRYPHAASPALSDVSLRLAAGEFVAVVGANGAGKSTLCAALCGLIPHFYRGQSAGCVTVAGLDPQTTTPGELARVVGYVGQNPTTQLSGVKFTVEEEVAFALENLGVAREEMRARVATALAEVGLEGLAGRHPRSLSGGQQQRLALAAALALQPRVLVLDEPTALLDPVGAEDFLQALLRRHQSGTTICLAEHKTDWVAEAADRVIALADGRVIAEGAPAEVFARLAEDPQGVRIPTLTRLALAARRAGLWPVARPLPVTLAEAREGFSAS